MNKATPIKINVLLKENGKYTLNRERHKIVDAILTINNMYYLTISSNDSLLLIPINDMIPLFELSSSIISVNIIDGTASFCQPSPRRTSTYAQMENDGREAFKNVFGFYPDDDFKAAMDRLFKK